MDELKKILQDESGEELERVASEAGTTVAYLRQLAGGHRKASPRLARKLEEVSGGRLTRQGLRPDIWGMVA